VKKHPRLNIQQEDARLKRSAQELTQLTRKFAPKWNRISNHGRMATERYAVSRPARPTRNEENHGSRFDSCCRE